MNEDIHLWIAVFVFVVMGIGLALTAFEFKQMKKGKHGK
jgi:hypothetical protein